MDERADRRDTVVKLAYIYYEGDSKLQPGLRRFFDSVYREDVRIRLVSGRGDSVSDFIKGMKSNSGATNILLKDSEGPGIQVALDGVRSHDHWDSRLDPQIPDDQLHFMVQVMESWFLADRQALDAYYGQNFAANRLPSNPNVEQVAKDDVLTGLEEATRRTQKGKYHKTRHAPDLLARIDVARVRSAAPACNRLFNALEALTS